MKLSRTGQLQRATNKAKLLMFAILKVLGKFSIFAFIKGTNVSLTMIILIQHYNKSKTTNITLILADDSARIIPSVPKCTHREHQVLLLDVLNHGSEVADSAHIQALRRTPSNRSLSPASASANRLCPNSRL